MKNRVSSAVILICLSLLVSPIVTMKAQGDLGVVKLAASTPTSAMTIYSVYGPVTYGKDFGLTASAEDITVYDSTVLATQAAVGGQANVLFGSFMSVLVLRQTGQDFKLFCPGNAKIDHVLVGRNGFTTLDQVFDPATRVGIDAPTGGASTVMNAIFAAKGMKTTTLDLKNVKRLDSIQLRQTAFAANDVDVTTMRLSQFRQTQKDAPDGVIIAKVYEDVPLFVFAAFTASSDWLNANRDLAAAYCAANLKGMLSLTGSLDTYNTAIKTYISKPPTDAVLKESFDLINQYQFWAPELTMNPAAISFMSGIAERTGLLTAPANPAEVLDLETYNAALKLLSSEDRAALMKMGKSSAMATATAEATAVK